MGTRGFIAFAANGELKVAYNHYDSYPSGLGSSILKWLQKTLSASDTAPFQLREQIKALRVIKHGEKPTPEDVKRLRPWTDLGVSEQSTDDWYCLLRNTQGNVSAMLAAGVIEDSGYFPADSLFAEWGYVIDLDGDGGFEVYRGFQKSPHTRGRFASTTPTTAGYYPVALVARWALADLPDEITFVSKVDPADEG